MSRPRETVTDVCHINFARGFRGGERQTELLVRELAARGLEQRLIHRAGAPLGVRLAGVAGLSVAAATSRIGASAAIGRTALIHAHETGGAQSAWLHSWLSPTPYVITRRVDNLPTNFTLTRRMYVGAARVVALSSAIAAVMSEYDARLRISRVPSAHSNLPHDPDRARRHRGRFAGKFVVGHIAAFDFAHKGQTYLMEAARRIERLHPQVHFLLLGAGRDEAALRELAAQRSNVTIEGWTEHVGDYLAAFDVFAFPSIREGLGSILLDAMQFGLPIVAARAGGIPDLVEHGRNGLLVPAQDAEALADAISQLFSDQGLRNAMSRTNKLAAHEYGPAIMAERYLKIYAEIAPLAAHVRGVS